MTLYSLLINNQKATGFNALNLIVSLFILEKCAWLSYALTSYNKLFIIQMGTFLNRFCSKRFSLFFIPTFSRFFIYLPFFNFSQLVKVEKSVDSFQCEDCKMYVITGQIKENRDKGGMYFLSLTHTTI